MGKLNICLYVIWILLKILQIFMSIYANTLWYKPSKKNKQSNLRNTSLLHPISQHTWTCVLGPACLNTICFHNGNGVGHVSSYGHKECTLDTPNTQQWLAKAKINIKARVVREGILVLKSCFLFWSVPKVELPNVSRFTKWRPFR